MSRQPRPPFELEPYTFSRGKQPVPDEVMAAADLVVHGEQSEFTSVSLELETGSYHVLDTVKHVELGGRRVEIGAVENGHPPLDRRRTRQFLSFASLVAVGGVHDIYTDKADDSFTPVTIRTHQRPEDGFLVFLSSRHISLTTPDKQTIRTVTTAEGALPQHPVAVSFVGSTHKRTDREAVERTVQAMFQNRCQVDQFRLNWVLRTADRRLTGPYQMSLVYSMGKLLTAVASGETYATYAQNLQVDDRRYHGITIALTFFGGLLDVGSRTAPFLKVDKMVFTQLSDGEVPATSPRLIPVHDGQ